eukprot:TRINITY_DN17039_c2_g1_i1.p1 TRINITY_DN17039_c2_g1~~TRINITY_DN17039_c2_g1_i1.p1  ORF type:complete len:296 (+),score=34.65 TRINITY_DN17039_c2_g1_i1:84-971(+)
MWRSVFLSTACSGAAAAGLQSFRFAATTKLEYADDLLIFLSVLPGNRIIAFDRKNRGEILHIDHTLPSENKLESLGRLSVHGNIWFDKAAYHVDADGQELFLASRAKTYNRDPHLLVWKLPVDASTKHTLPESPLRLDVLTPGFKLVGNRENNSLYISDHSGKVVERIEFSWKRIWDEGHRTSKELFTRHKVPLVEGEHVDRDLAYSDHGKLDMSWDQLQGRGKVQLLESFRLDTSSIPQDSSVPSPRSAEAVAQNTYCFAHSGALRDRPELLALGHDWGRVTVWESMGRTCTEE